MNGMSRHGRSIHRGRVRCRVYVLLLCHVRDLRRDRWRGRDLGHGLDLDRCPRRDRGRNPVQESGRDHILVCCHCLDRGRGRDHCHGRGLVRRTDRQGTNRRSSCLGMCSSRGRHRKEKDETSNYNLGN